MSGEQDSVRRYYEYIVIGCGGVGSAAVYWLSKRAGADVLGIEQFNIGHDNGGSQDVSRIIRLTYHDDRYTKLTPHTYKAWEEVEQESGIQLVHKCGGVQFAKKGEVDDLIKNYTDSMDRCNISYEVWSGSQLHRRFPQFETDDSHIAVYDKGSGLVNSGLGIAVHTQLARSHGATIIENCPVLRLERSPGGGVKVHTTKGVFQCRRLIVAAGAWLNHVLNSIGVNIPVFVTQEQVTYLATPNIKEFTKERFPIWFYHTPTYDFYGLPIYSNSGVKIGIDAGGPVVTANTRSFEPDPVREKICVDFLKKHMPRSVGPKLYSKTCLYTMTPDRHFVVDTCAHKGFDDVIVCCGGGHIYKFSSLMGKILSQIAIDGKTQYDISKFNIDRDALKDSNYRLDLFMGARESAPEDLWKDPSGAAKQSSKL